MSDATLKTVVDADRVRREMRTRRRLPEALPGMGGVEQEMLAEMAAAFGRAHQKLADAIAALEQAYAVLAAASGADRPAAAQHAAAQRQAALQARWELEVHREALGLNRHDALDRSFPLPRPPQP